MTEREALELLQKHNRWRRSLLDGNVWPAKCTIILKSIRIETLQFRPAIVLTSFGAVIKRSGKQQKTSQIER